jgi:lipopolysaccharide biosynthesis regulator YciM
LAQIYVREKRFDQAIAEYESILEKNPKYLAGIRLDRFDL